MKVVQEMLRHSSITVTSDTYTSVLPEVARSAAEKTVLIIPRNRPKPLGHVSGTPRPLWRVNMLAVNTKKRRPTLMLTCALGVRRQGLEPRTRWLRATCLGCRVVTNNANIHRFRTSRPPHLVRFYRPVPCCVGILGLPSGSLWTTSDVP
jgi:hypothetical protein